MTPEEIVKKEAEEFQDTILRSNRQHIHPYVVFIPYSGEYALFPDVFNPVYAKASLFLNDFIHNKNPRRPGHEVDLTGKRVLDPFTGCGIHAISAAQGFPSKVVAVDINPMAALCAQYNALNLLSSYTAVDFSVRKGDFSDVLEEGEEFDWVVANPPFKNMRPEDRIEAAIRDENYATLSRFFSTMPNHLATDGSMRVVFSDVGDVNFFESEAKRYGFKHSVIATERYASSVRIMIYDMTLA